MSATVRELDPEVLRLFDRSHGATHIHTCSISFFLAESVGESCILPCEVGGCQCELRSAPQVHIFFCCQTKGFRGEIWYLSSNLCGERTGIEAADTSHP